MTDISSVLIVQLAEIAQKLVLIHPEIYLPVESKVRNGKFVLDKDVREILVTIADQFDFCQVNKTWQIHFGLYRWNILKNDKILDKYEYFDFLTEFFYMFCQTVVLCQKRVQSAREFASKYENRIGYSIFKATYNQLLIEDEQRIFKLCSIENWKVIPAKRQVVGSCCICSENILGLFYYLTCKCPINEEKTYHQYCIQKMKKEDDRKAVVYRDHYNAEVEEVDQEYQQGNITVGQRDQMLSELVNNYSEPRFRCPYCRTNLEYPTCIRKGCFRLMARYEQCPFDGCGKKFNGDVEYQANKSGNQEIQKHIALTHPICCVFCSLEYCNKFTHLSCNFIYNPARPCLINCDKDECFQERIKDSTILNGHLSQCTVNKLLIKIIMTVLIVQAKRAKGLFFQCPMDGKLLLDTLKLDIAIYNKRIIGFLSNYDAMEARIMKMDLIKPDKINKNLLY